MNAGPGLDLLADLIRRRHGIMQQDAVLTELGSILLMGHTSDPDRTFVATADPPVEPFDASEWSNFPVMAWRLA